MAHLLTAVRLGLAVPALLAFARPGYMPPLLLAGLMIVAIASDFLDGMVARRRGTASAKGQLFDHTTDFLFVTSGLAGAAMAGQVSPILPALIVVAFSQYVLDSYLLYREKHLHMSFLGRWNGIFYFAPLIAISASRLLATMDTGSLAGTTPILDVLVLGSSYVLLLTTAASIVDRAIAPLRPGSMAQRTQAELH